MSMLSPCIGNFCTMMLLSGYCERIHCWQVVPNCFMDSKVVGVFRCAAF